MTRNENEAESFGVNCGALYGLQLFFEVPTLIFDGKTEDKLLIWWKSRVGSLRLIEVSDWGVMQCGKF